MPQKIKIGWKEYDIIHEKVNPHLISDGTTCYGRVYYDERKIYINTDYDKEQQKCTLIHEVLHGIEELYNLKLEEEIIETLANSIYTFIKDNPKLFTDKEKING